MRRLETTLTVAALAALTLAVPARAQDDDPGGYVQSQEQNSNAALGAVENWDNSVILEQQPMVDPNGKGYTVPNGSNYYWVNPNTSDVYGTDTYNPPDYSNPYQQLTPVTPQGSGGDDQ